MKKTTTLRTIHGSQQVTKNQNNHTSKFINKSSYK